MHGTGPYATGTGYDHAAASRDAGRKNDKPYMTKREKPVNNLYCGKKFCIFVRPAQAMSHDNAGDADKTSQRPVSASGRIRQV